MGPQAQSRAQHDFIEHRSGGVDHELAALSGANHPAEVACVDGDHRDGTVLSEEALGPDRIAVAAPDSVTLRLEELCQKGAGCSCPQNEDPHGVSQTVSQTSRRPEWSKPLMSDCGYRGGGVHFRLYFRSRKPAGEKTKGLRDDFRRGRDE